MGKFIKPLLTCCFLIAQFWASAQCAMCKATAEQSIEQGSTSAQWINGGVLYMLVVPYLAIGIIFYKWYKQYKKEKN